jgi:hypothetical protein
MCHSNFLNGTAKQSLRPGAGKKLSRKNLIFALRHQMGGGHVDANITDDALQWLVRGAHVLSPEQWKDAQGNVVESPAPEVASGPVPNGHWATMRQIGWELDFALTSLGL